MEDKQFEKISKALSDTNRIAILNALKKKTSCLHCSEVQDMLNLAQPSVSHHLKQLVEADILLPEKEGRNLKYTLNEVMLDSYIDALQGLKRCK